MTCYHLFSLVVPSWPHSSLTGLIIEGFCANVKESRLNAARGILKS